MPDEIRSIEDRRERIKQIDARLAELDAEYSDSAMTDESREEWNTLNGERDQHDTTVAELERRRERMRQLASNPAAGERAVQTPAFIPNHGDDIYDLHRIRMASRTDEDYRSRLHDNARRSIEKAKFGVTSKEQDGVREHVETLLERADDKEGTLARRILATGSPVYDRAFGKAVIQGGVHTLTGEEQRAALSTVDANGGLAVPYQLDPTVILTNDGTQSDLRKIARVEQITGRTWRGITSSGVSVSRSAEGAAATGNEFTVAQPEVETSRVIADVQFSVEIDLEWAQLRNEIATVLQDAKQQEEDVSFVTGDGAQIGASSNHNPSGVLTTLNASSDYATAGVGTLALTDLDDLEMDLGPRFRGKAVFLANKSIYKALRTLARAENALAQDRWVNMLQDVPAQLDGYSAYEATAMTAGPVSTASGRVLLFGDFSKFMIVDRLGMNIELNPHVVNGSGRWTGQRSLVAVWFNGSKILADNAFRALKVKAA